MNREEQRQWRQRIDTVNEKVKKVEEALPNVSIGIFLIAFFAYCDLVTFSNHEVLSDNGDIGWYLVTAGTLLAAQGYTLQRAWRKLQKHVSEKHEREKKLSRREYKTRPLGEFIFLGNNTPLVPEQSRKVKLPAEAAEGTHVSVRLRKDSDVIVISYMYEGRAGTHEWRDGSFLDISHRSNESISFKSEDNILYVKHTGMLFPIVQYCPPAEVIEKKISQLSA